MNINNLTTGSLGVRLSNMQDKFIEMKRLIISSITESCLALSIEPLEMSSIEFRDPKKIFTQYFSVAEIDFCEQNRSAISTICFNLRNNISSMPLEHGNHGTVRFLSHVDKKVGFIIEIYLSVT